jgi:ubiquinone/menaquinone biosynthesis C-methylase UbiE
MPFKSSKFDTACLIACLNHIPKSNREKVLSEIYRLLKDEGRLIVTMLSPFVGNLCHKLVWWDWDRKERGIHEGEDYGLSNSYVIKLITEQKFNGIFFV